MEYKRMMKDGFNLLAGQIGAVFIGLLSTMILTRVLTPEEMGQYSLFFMIESFAVMFVFTWSDSSLIRHGREEYLKYKKINKSFWARSTLFFPLIILVSLLFMIFSKQISDYLGIEQKFIGLVIAVFILNGILNTIIKIYQSIDLQNKSAYVNLVQRTLYLFGLIFIYFNIFRPSIPIVIFFIMLSFLLSLAYYLLTLKWKLLLPYTFQKSYFRKILNYSWPQIFGFSGLYVINYIDLYVIRQYMSLTDVGVYSIAYKGFEVISGVILLVNALVMPLIVEYKTKKKYNDIENYIKKIPLFSFGWAILVIGGILVSKYVLPLAFSDKYVAAVPSFNVLLVATLFYFIWICLVPVINAFDIVLFSQVINIFKAVLNIVFDFILIPKIGIIGAAYSTLISYVVGLVLSILLVYLNRERIFLSKNGSKK